MSLALAIADLVAAAGTVSGVEVLDEIQERNRSNYTLIITQGERLRVPQFGSSRVTQGLNLVLLIKKPDPAAVSGKISEIEAAILADRRRDGNAQTTTNPTEWLVTEDEGREGVELTSTIGVVVYES